MPSWKGKTRGGLLGYQIFIFILKKSGLKAAYGLLRLVAAYFVLFAPSATKNIYSYFRNVHHYGFIKSVIAVYKNFYVFGQTLLDKVAVIAGVQNKFTYTFDGEEYLLEFKKRNTGGMLISAHLGNWEIAGFLLKRIDMRVNIVMFEAEHERIKKYMEGIMKNESVNIIPIKNDLSHIFLISKALRNKEIICMHGDRFMEGSKVAVRNFMGRDAYFPLGPFSIATKLNVPVTFVYAVKSSADHYYFSSTPVIEKGTSEVELLDQYVKTLEEKVKQHPLQWFNYYDFWSTDLKGGIYDQKIKNG
ncbi:MAG: LpxL/LpxP family acyltransferase [Candidatus Cyclobacteriaceae bacterium M2_1C_046]